MSHGLQVRASGLDQLLSQKKLTAKYNAKAISFYDKHGKLIYSIPPSGAVQYLEFINKSSFKSHLALKSLLKEVKNTSKNIFNPKRALEKGIKVKASKRGFVPNFKGTKFIHPNGIQRIKLTGRRS